MNRLRKFLLAIVIMFVALPIARAEQSDLEPVTLNLNSSRHFELPSDISRVFLGSSKLVSIVQLTPSMNEFVVTARDTEGSTTLFVWTVDGIKHEYLITVTKEELGQSLVIERAIGLPDVRVKKLGDRILLTGSVKNQYERNYAVQVARLYVGGGSQSSLSFGSTVNMTLETQGADSNSSTDLASDNKVEDSGNVIDLLKMISPTQIRLEAQIIALNPQDLKEFGIDYSGGSTPGVFYMGESYNRGSDHTLRHNPWRWLVNRRTDINVTINALITKNRAKLLSRPSIMTMSGEEAVIQVGGKVPYPIDTGDNMTVEWQDYGIILQLKPLVDADNRIVSAVHAEISNIGTENVLGYPIIETRRADSVVTMNAGTTMVIGGLMDSEERKVVRKIPLIGEIPIIGEFFKYSQKRKDKQEMLILVTPHLVDDEQASQTEMSDTMQEFYNQKQLEKNNLNPVNVNE